MRGCGALDQYGAHHEIRVDDILFDRRCGGVGGAKSFPEAPREPLEHPRISIEDGDVGTKAECHLNRIGPDDTPAEYDHLRRRHAGDAPQQETGAAAPRLETRSACLNRHAPRDLGHGSEQGQPALRIGHRFVCDAGRAARDEIRRLLGVRREMEISEEGVMRPQERALGDLGLLDLHNEFGQLEYFLRRRDDLGADCDICIVRCVNADTSIRFDEDFVPGHSQFVHAFRRQSDAEFRILDFLRNSDAQGGPSHPINIWLHRRL